MIVCAGEIESFGFAEPIGIGLVNSAINLTKKVLLNPPEYLLFVGTAGSYGKHHILDIVTSSTAANIELSFLEQKSYTPLDNLISSREKILADQTIVNSSNYITTNENLAKKLLDLKIEIENMEFFAVVSVAKEFDLPVAGVFCVTNYCHAEAHEEFKTNHKKAMEKLENYAKTELFQLHNR